ncbi:MAG TPA: helix-turn-helix domain-containing protein [Sphingomicrobium sp.]|nr:helix-turn-helix domain-containing protein [Sphingomicrobium sp.]
MDEELVETDVPSVGERLRAAREEKGLSLEDIAAQTRIPRRHLEAIEGADWDRLPAPTYTIGFARSYASVVGLDRADIADQLRGEMGGSRATPTAEVFEPADPARTMPKGLVIGAILAVIVLVLVMSWLSRRSLEQPDETAANTAAPAASATPPPAAAPPAAPAAQGPVVLTASDAVWLQVSEKGGATLFSGLLQPGQSYTVPATATAPVLKTGKPEALRVTVGTAVAPPVGPAATRISDVSLLPADLLRAGAAAAPAPAAPAPRPAGNRPAPRSTPPAPAAPQPAPPPSAPPPEPTNNAAAT